MRRDPQLAPRPNGPRKAPSQSAREAMAETDLILLQSAQPAPGRLGEEAGPTVYFDGACPLCTAEIGHYSSRPGGERLRFVDVASDDADPGPDLPLSDARARFHVRLPDGRLLSGARAFVALWAALPGWRWLAAVARIPGVLVLMEIAYRLFLPVRPLLSRIARALGARGATERR